jgi:hypothetical protein
MTECSTDRDLFPVCKSREIRVDFHGGNITSDAGGLLLRQADRKAKLTEAVAAVLSDPRRQKSCEHRLLPLLRQRVYGLALGYADLNDHEHLRHDVALQTFVERDATLAHPATLCRFENRADRETAAAISGVLVEQFIRSQRRRPARLILDVDATDDPVHGQQEGRFFHGYYDQYCFLPLYVFCGSQVLVAYLRPSNIDVARHAWAIVALLVKRLRQQWPQVEIIVRADSGFCRWRMLRWCDAHQVGYVVGLAKNSRISALAHPLIEAAREQFEKTGEKQRRFATVQYAAQSWDRARRVIVKAEHAALGSNPRYVVTNLDDAPQALYDDLYCARGDMENRIKEQQLDLFADRTSCHRWWPNQLRLLLSSLAYVLMETIRRLGLKGTELAQAQCGTIRLKLFKIGAIVLRNTRRIRLHLCAACPSQRLFFLVARRLASG